MFSLLALIACKQDLSIAEVARCRPYNCTCAHRACSTNPARHCAQVKNVIEEEWSYIPVGGPLPLGDQPVTAFGAAANLVHPATGYSIARSLREAPALAAEMAGILRRDLPVQQTARQVRNALWPAEKRRQVSHLACCMKWTEQVTARASCCAGLYRHPSAL